MIKWRRKEYCVFEKKRECKNTQHVLGASNNFCKKKRFLFIRSKLADVKRFFPRYSLDPKAFFLRIFLTRSHSFFAGLNKLIKEE